MDAVTFLKEAHRMCIALHQDCDDCPLVNNEYCNLRCWQEEQIHLSMNYEEIVAVVEKWSKENPLVTNGDKVMEIIKDAGVPVTARGSGFDREVPLNTVHIVVSENWWDAEYKGEE